MEQKRTLALPTRATLKAQAKRLRSDLTAQGKPTTHAQALEAIAHQWGARDWNTLHAQAPDTLQRSFTPGERISGLYLGHAFQGTVKAAQMASAGFWRLTVVFDDAVDVVESQHFTGLRKQVSATIGPQGHTAQKTSNGQPHMVLDAW